MEIKADVKITAKDMYLFFMHHTYTRPSGIVSIFFGAAMFGLMLYTYGDVPQGQSALYLMFGVFFLVFNPINFYGKAKMQVKTVPIFKEPITYIFNEEGITTQQNDQAAHVKWQDVQKAVSTGSSIILYFDKVRASIVPKSELGPDYERLAALIKDKMEPAKVKIK